MFETEFVVTREGMTVDLCCWLHFYSAEEGETFELPEGVVERTLEANPDVAWLPLHLPLGTRLKMPPLPEEPTNKLLRIWD